MADRVPKIQRFSESGFELVCLDQSFFDGRSVAYEGVHGLCWRDGFELLHGMPKRRIRNECVLGHFHPTIENIDGLQALEDAKIRYHEIGLCYGSNVVLEPHKIDSIFAANPRVYSSEKCCGQRPFLYAALVDGSGKESGIQNGSATDYGNTLLAIGVVLCEPGQDVFHLGQRLAQLPSFQPVHPPLGMHLLNPWNVVVILKKIIDDVPIRRSLISGMQGILKGSLCGFCGNGNVCGFWVHESPEWTAKLIGSGGNKKASMMPAFLWYYRDSNLGHTDFQSVALPTEL